MSDPSIIRTEFASAEDAADVYGVPHNRVAALHRVLSGDEDTIKPVERRRLKEALARKRSRKKTSRQRSQ